MERPQLAESRMLSILKGGGARRDRTADLLHAMQALSQLSYGPTMTALSGVAFFESCAPSATTQPQADYNCF